MAVTADKAAPYAPAKTVVDLIGRFRSRGLPPPIVGDVLRRAGVSESLIPRTLQALETLDLINENGMPTPTFEGIRVAPEAEYKKRLADWLKAVYADVFAFADPATDDETAIRDAFRNYQPIGQQGRMVTLFTGLCAAAGLMPEKPQSVRPRIVRASPAPRPAATPIMRHRARAAAAMATPTGLPAPLAGLLASLPVDGGWTRPRRDQFVAAFGTVLDFCVPLVEEEVVVENENGGT